MRQPGVADEAGVAPRPARHPQHRFTIRQPQHAVRSRIGHLRADAVLDPFERRGLCQLFVRRRLREVHLSIVRSEEHTSELQSLMRLSDAVFCLNTNNTDSRNTNMSRTTQLNSDESIDIRNS